MINKSRLKNLKNFWINPSLKEIFHKAFLEEITLKKSLKEIFLKVLLNEMPNKVSLREIFLNKSFQNPNIHFLKMTRIHGEIKSKLKIKIKNEAEQNN